MGLIGISLDLVYPRICEICKVKITDTYRSSICENCFSRIQVLSGALCPRCSRPVALDNTICKECSNNKLHFEKIWSWGIYDGILKQAIQLMKYGKKAHMYAAFDNIINNFSINKRIMTGIDVIIPVPLHRIKLLDRGFNQARILAGSINTGNKRIIDDILIKRIKTPPQHHLSRLNRIKNLKGAFRVVDSETVHGKNVLLIDDVFTTGSTMNECALVLKQAGAGNVRGFTLARGV